MCLFSLRTGLADGIDDSVERIASNPVLHCDCHFVGNAGEGNLLRSLSVAERRRRSQSQCVLPCGNIFMFEKNAGSRFGDHRFVWF